MADAQNEIVDLTVDSDVTLSATTEDDDLHRAIVLSLQSMPTSPAGGSSASTSNGPTGDKSGRHKEPVAAIGQLRGLDRKSQEEERLARLKRKRELSVSPPSLDRDPRATGDLSAAPANSNGKPKSETAELLREGKLCTSISALGSSLQYPNGVVKKTWAFGFNRENDIKLEEVLQRHQLEAAVLSSYQWDWDWLLPKMNTQRTKFVFVLQAKDERTKQQYQSDFRGVNNVRLCFPPMDGQVNCMHSKLMLLFYPTHLRIVVPTANLAPYDWGEPFRDLEGGVIENTVFLVDLPRTDLRAGEVQQADIPFLQSLLYFLEAMKLQEDVIKKLRSFDFSKMAQHGFVHSIAGSHCGDTWRETGACGLGQFLHKLGLRTFDSVEMDYVASSVGALNDRFLRSLYLVGQGDSGLAEYTLRTTKSVPPGALRDVERRVGADYLSGWEQHFRFYYPSDDTVRRSKGGPGCGGTICFHPKWWNASKFPRNQMRDCRSRREGLLMHNKIWFSRYVKPVTMKSGQQALGWTYVGSANLSESAWGILVRDGTTKTPKLSCRNWECGVVIPIVHGNTEPVMSSIASGQDLNSMDGFANVVPVPMKLPGQTYQYQGYQEPWFGGG